MFFFVSDEDGGTFTKSLAIALNTNCSTTIVCISSTDRIFNELNGLTPNVVWVQVAKRWPTLPQLFSIYRLIGKSTSEIVFASGYVAHTVGMILGLLARKNNKIFVRHFTDTHHRLSKAHWFFLDLFINSIANKIITVSSLVSHLMREVEHVRGIKLHLVHNSIDVNLFERLRAQRNMKHVPRQRIILVARQTKGKGLLTAIDAFHEFSILCEEAHLDLFGEPSDISSEVLSKLALLNPSKYTNHGKVYDQSEIYSSASVLIHVPERKEFESFGLVYLEGLAVGMQCIFSESGILYGRNNPFDADHIWFVEHRSASHITDCLVKIILDNERKQIVPIEYFQKYSIKSVVDQYIEVIYSK